MTSLPRHATRSLTGALALVAALGALLIACHPATVSAETASVEFSPTGQVKAPRQAHARFSRAMVHLGDPQAARDPFIIACPVAGTGRWRDSRTWVFDFAAELPGGIVCTFTLHDPLTSLDGTAVAPATFSFNTGGPKIESYDPAWGELEEGGAVLLRLDAPATTTSILEHVRFEIDGVGDAVGVHLIEGEQRAAILAALPPERRQGPIVIIRPRQQLPAGKKVRLVWGAGVSSLGGIATDRDERIKFRVREPLRVRLRCSRLAPKTACNPLRPIEVHFTAAVPAAHVRNMRLRDAAGTAWLPDIGDASDAPVTAARFRGPFSESMRLTLHLPDGLADETGRTPINADRFPLTTETAPFPPLVKFPARFGIVEAEADPAAVVTVRNVERELRVLAQRATEPRDRSWSARAWRAFDALRGQTHVVSANEIERVIPWLQRLTRTPRDASIFASPAPAASEVQPREFTLPKPLAASETEVVGIPLPMPGLHLIEIESPLLGAALLGKEASMFVPTAALVTNLGVHFKWGAAGALAWVTQLDRAQPVGGADVFVLDCDGTQLWKGITGADGTVAIAGLPAPSAARQCPRDEWPDDFWTEDYRALRGIDGGLFVIARSADDFTFVHTSWNEGIEAWRFGIPTAGYGDPTPAAIHTILDRTLFRAGDTVHMKHILRQRTPGGVELLSPDATPETQIVHTASGEAFSLGATESSPGTALASWKIPAGAKLGRYQVRVGIESDWHHTASFRIEEFRVPLMAGSIAFPVEQLVGTTAVTADLGLTYRAGGPAGDAPVTVRAQVRPATFTARFPWNQTTFGNGPVSIGTVRHALYQDDAEEPDGSALENVELRLDSKGSARVSLDPPGPVVGPSELLVDMEYRDPVGEVQSVVRALPVFPAERLVAIEPERWTGSDKALRAQVVVVDLRGDPVPGVAAEVTVFRRQTYSHRKRLVGGFYAYSHATETTGPLAELCRGTTDAHGAFPCEGQTDLSGNLILQASIDDGHGRTSSAHAEVWVAGADDWWFRVEDHDRIDLIPEQYELSTTGVARLQVRSPFANATALVTVEREGLLDAFVTPVSGRNPVIEVPMRRSYAPNVFFSALLVSSRISGVQPTARVDLGRPAYKLGITELRVGWDDHRLRVAVEPTADTYQVRESADVRIQVERVSGGSLPTDAEVAVAAVDEGLLELSPNPTWNVLAALMQLRLHWVGTATAQGQIVGKRHFGRKALPSGGGGGAQTIRELFDTLLYWNPRVPLDADGRATVTIPLNDSLTSFRVVAVASAGADQFGTGSNTIRTTQDLMLISSLPPVVRVGDRFPARFTVRNASNIPMEVALSLSATAVAARFEPRSIQLQPGASAEVEWPIEVPDGPTELRYRVNAQAAGASDALAVTQKAIPVHRVETVQAELQRIDQPSTVLVARPQRAELGRGGIRLDVRRSLAEQTSGVTDYMRGYEFTCLEQQVSQAIALRDPQLWEDVVERIPSHRSPNGLLGFFPGSPHGSAELTAYVLAVTAASGFAIPDDLRAALIAALLRTLGSDFDPGPAVPTSSIDRPLWKLTVIEALARNDAAHASMLEAIEIEPEYWPTASVLDLWSITRRLADSPVVSAWRSLADKTLHDRMRLTGSGVGFGGSQRLGWSFLTCADSLPLRYILDRTEEGASAEEIAPWIHASFLRQRAGRWDCTTSNAWGATALAQFTSRHESQAIDGTTSARLGDDVAQATWDSTDDSRRTIELAWPAEPSELRLEHDGSGAPWAMLQLRAAIPLVAPQSAGYRIEKTFEPVVQREPGRFSRGDVWRVRLDIAADDDAAWVVIDDPLPPGAAHLGTGLGAASLLDPSGDEDRPWWMAGPSYVERRHESFRAYYEWFPEGAATVAYTIRLNQDGAFSLPATRLEAMYAPERHGAVPNAALEIAP